MRVFDIGPLLEQIETFLSAEAEAIQQGIEPDPNDIKLRNEITELLVQEGPSAVERFWDLIDMTQGDVNLLSERIKELRARKDARERAVERMKGVLQDLLNRHFEGKIKTATLTTWTQKTTTYEVSGADPQAHPQFFKVPPPELKKSLVLDQYKAGLPLPKGVEVTEGWSESVRVKR